VKRWNFRRLIVSAFAFSHESVQRLPPPDTSNIEGAYQDFWRAYYLRPNNASHVAVGRTMCHAETECETSIASSSEPWWGLTLIEPPRLYHLGSGRRSSSDGRKLSIPLTSCTLATRRGAPSTNLLACLDAPFTSAPSRQTPSPRNL